MMKAAIVTALGMTPVYADFDKPSAREGEELISVRAAALSNLTRSRASGSHYSSSSLFPSIVGTDGVGLTQDGRRVYFAMPEAPNGSMAEFCPIHLRRCIAIPDAVDDITAAAIANPGMSAWSALMERAHLVAGEIVLVNGATGTAGRIAVQLAKHLGAARVIATGRNQKELEELKAIGADETIPFVIDADHPRGSVEYEEALQQAFLQGIDVVIDYLWGKTAEIALTALAKTIEDHPVRFVHVGGSSGEMNIQLPGAVLRSSAITLMGSGVGSVSRKDLVQSIAHVFDAVVTANLEIATQAVPLAKLESVWPSAIGKPRMVFTIGD
jgi:NADPH:quinone reductase-like Zn-dependent oxidoreductase